jgi:DNA-binding beta-propeller fold protein YncE
VGAGGDIYVMRTCNVGGFVGGRVDVFGPDGKPKKDDLVDGMGCGDCGLGVDAAGNVYVGSNVKPADAPLPLGFAGKVPDKPWVWWRGAEREVPWRYPYCNPYLFQWGAAFKFGPEGGVFYGHNQPMVKDPKFEARPADKLDAAPADAVSLRTSCLSREIKVAGAKWRYQGMGPIPGTDGPSGDPGCVCYNSHLAVDPYGRVYVPNVFRFSVEMLDTGGNSIARIGRYGNADSAGPGSKVPEPEIAFAWPAFVSEAGGKLFVGDAVNHRVVVVKFDHAAEETCEIQ